MNPASTPRCVGIIMDGNRRWAKAKGFPTLEGHRRGYEKLKEVMRWAKAAGVSYAIVYGFSTENWNRSAEEVSYLMDLIRVGLTKGLETFKKEGIRIRCIGGLSRFSAEMQELMKKAEAETAALAGPTLVLALSSGGRAEILAAAEAAAAKGLITEQSFSDSLWTSGIPDPDLIIRSSGEMRLSGFLPWQAVYSELFFTKTLWPDFDEVEFTSIMEEFGKRERRNGK